MNKKSKKILIGVSLVLVGAGMIPMILATGGNGNGVAVISSGDGKTTVYSHQQGYHQYPNQTQPQNLPVHAQSQSINLPSPPPTSQCSADALAVGIKHHRYNEPNAKDLVTIMGAGGRKLQIHHEAKDALESLMVAARQDGVTLTVGSAFRSIKYQQGIIDRKKQKGFNDKKIYTMSAPAGYSEHHTGFAVDFSPIDSGFAKTKGYAWLLKNAHKYGWEQSFTAQSTAKGGLYQGISEESWHWKYLGTPTAKAMLTVTDCQ